MKVKTIAEIEKIERKISKKTADIWNTFLTLEQTHPSDVSDLANAIHDIQKIIAIRMVRRLDPDMYVTIKATDKPPKENRPKGFSI